jgi:hypothetical protein
VCRSGLWGMLQQAETHWCSAVSCGGTTGSCAITIHLVSPPLQSITFFFKKPIPNHHPAIKFSIFHSARLLDLPKIWDGSQRSTFCAHGGNSSKYDCKFQSHARKWLPEALPAILGSQEQVCMRRKTVLWAWLNSFFYISLGQLTVTVNITTVHFVGEWRRWLWWNTSNHPHISLSTHFLQKCPKYKLLIILSSTVCKNTSE